MGGPRHCRNLVAFHGRGNNLGQLPGQACGDRPGPGVGAVGLALEPRWAGEAECAALGPAAPGGMGGMSASEDGPGRWGQGLGGQVSGMTLLP